MGKDFSRRELALLVGGAAVAAEVVRSAQEGRPSDPLAAARTDIRRAVEEMEKFDLSMFTEPAFIFKP